MWHFLTQLATLSVFYNRSRRWIVWLSYAFALLFCAGLYGGLFLAPSDYQQGESYRIIFVHVPSAWMSMFVYMTMAFYAFITLVWKTKLSEIIVASSAPIGASFTFLVLVTGSLWGKPMWGTWWEWDARLTFELILLFQYMGIIALYTAIEDKRKAARACSMLTLVGVINIPIIHYSVIWWNTLHQGPTVSKFDAPSIDITMLIPLLLMAVAFMIFYAIAVLLKMRNEILERERNTQWVKTMLEQQS